MNGMGILSRDLLTSRVQQFQESLSFYYIPFSSPRPLLPNSSFHIIGAPTPPRVFTPLRGLSTSNRMDGYVQRSIIHASRATSLEFLVYFLGGGICSS